MNKKSLLNISGNKIENVKDFKHLRHMFYSDQNDSFVDNRILTATGNFYVLKYVLTDPKVSVEKGKKFFEAYVRSRLVYCTKAQLPNEEELRNVTRIRLAQPPEKKVKERMEKEK